MPNASGDEVLPEDAIFRFELIGEFPQQLFYPAEDLGRQTDGINASDSGHLESHQLYSDARRCCSDACA